MWWCSNEKCRRSIRSVQLVLLPLLVVLVAIHVGSTPTISPLDIAKWSANRTFIITGANSGLGYHTVLHLVQAGTAQTVIMACRNMDSCETARREILNSVIGNEQQLSSRKDGVQVICRKLDLSSLSSIRNFSNQLRLVSKSQHANITLILNAGIMGDGAAPNYSNETGVEMQIQVNHLSHFFLTHLLFHQLDEVVTVSSLAASLPWNVLSAWDRPVTMNFWNNYMPSWLDAITYYGKSKRANLLFASELHHRYYSNKNGSVVKSVVSHPGYTRTRLMLNGWRFAPLAIRKFFHINPIGSMSGEQGALTQLRAALDPTIPSNSYMGPRFIVVGDPVVVGTAEWSWHQPFALSKQEGLALWEKSLQILKIDEFGVKTSQDYSKWKRRRN